MKVINISLLVLCAAIELSGCRVSGNHHPLMGGIGDKQVMRGGEKSSEEGGFASDNSENMAVTDADGIEIPAKLSGRPEQILKREGYTASYNKDLKIPNWVAWHLTASHAAGKYKRAGVKFHEDEEVAEPRVVDWDYARSGYDRGHMCPSGDNKWSERAQEQSFLFTNMCPQDHGLNIGDWNEMENQCRRWAKDYGDIYIVCGPILYKGKHKTIGKDKVVVPEAFFKVVLCMKGVPKAIGFIYKNEDGNRPKGDYVNTVDQVERITGIDFFTSLPDNIEKKVEAEADLNDWK